MFLGIAQMFFLSLVIFIRSNRNSAIRLFGWSLLIQALVCTDTYLCYTGYMKYILHWNDSTEVFVLLIAPSIYFFTYSLLERKPIILKKHWVHFLLPTLYLFSQISYFTSPLPVKLNAYLDAYHDTLGMVPVPDGVTYEYQIIKDRFRWLILFNFALYLVLCAILIFKKRGQRKLPTYKVIIDKYAFTQSTIILLMLLLLITLGIYLRHEDDGGDHYIVIFVGSIAFISSFFVLSESRFFENSWVADKYETLTSNTIAFESIKSFIEEEEYVLLPHASLKDLAHRLGSNANTISKVINSKTGVNFNDFINQKRIEKAKAKLIDPNFGHLTVEAIGESVGFKSKSAFYNAFKKHVGLSPTQYIRQNTP